MFTKPKELKQTSKEIIKKVADESKEKIIRLVKDNINKTIQKLYFNLIHGKGVKTKPLNKHSEQLLKIITKKIYLITKDYWNIDSKQLSLLPYRKRNRIILKNKDNNIVNQGEAWIISTNLESFFRFTKSYIQVFVKVVKENGNNLDDTDEVSLINNGKNFSKQIVLEGNSNEYLSFYSMVSSLQ